ncbi:MAG: TRAP transporter small permease [Asticcacaulis sp.]
MNSVRLRALHSVFNRFSELAAKGLIWAASFGLLLMTAFIAWQVFGRFILQSSPSWTEQAALFLMIWFVSLAAAAGVREGFHIRITAVEESAPPRIRQFMQTTANIIVGLIGVTMLIWGGELVIKTWNHAIPSLSLTRGMAYLGLPLSGALIALFSIENVLNTLIASSSKLEGDA